MCLLLLLQKLTPFYHVAILQAFWCDKHVHTHLSQWTTFSKRSCSIWDELCTVSLRFKVFFTRTVLQPQSQIFYLITLYDTYNIEQNEARHCSQRKSVWYWKTVWTRMELVGFCWTWYFPTNGIADWRMTLVWFYIVDRP